jgi:hypothetical protein
MTSPIISIKKITLPEFGLKETSNQSHIGLFSKTFEAIDLEKSELILKVEHSSAKSEKNYFLASNLIFKNRSYETISILKYIKDKNTNKYRSPAIRKGNQNEMAKYQNLESTYDKIIYLSESNCKKINYFLISLYLETGELIFILIEENSSDFVYLKELLKIPNLKDPIDGVDEKWKRHFTKNDVEFIPFSTFISDKYNSSNEEYLSELEIASQTGEENVTRRVIPRIRDIEKANELFKNIGLKGEELLYQYFELQKNNSFIKNFKWMNQSKETGMPYDFEITNNDNSIIYSDAKSTGYRFEQKMVFSSSELNFVNKNKDNYLVHRIYDIDTAPKFKICDNVYEISELFLPKFNGFYHEMKSMSLDIQSLKIAVPSDLDILHFQQPVAL